MITKATWKKGLLTIEATSTSPHAILVDEMVDRTSAPTRYAVPTSVVLAT